MGYRDIIIYIDIIRSYCVKVLFFIIISHRGLNNNNTFQCEKVTFFKTIRVLSKQLTKPSKNHMTFEESYKRMMYFCKLESVPIQS